jgi:hypothetical protein
MSRPHLPVVESADAAHEQDDLGTTQNCRMGHRSSIPFHARQAAEGTWETLNQLRFGQKIEVIDQRLSPKENIGRRFR